MDRIELIEKWFDDGKNEDDFIRCSPIYPFTIICPPQDQTKIIYCTKSHIIFSAITDWEKSIGFGLISQSGLPNNSSVGWLRDIIGNRELLFIGDLDPVDLFIFSWLRERLHPAVITHSGINDQFISRLSVNVPPEFRISMSGKEAAAVASLQDVLPDAHQLLGADCLEVLNTGSKIELEAIVSALGNAAPILLQGVDL